MFKKFSKYVKIIAALSLVASIATINHYSEVGAAPTIKAMVMKNGSLVDLGTDTAKSNVYLVSDTPCLFQLYGNSMGEGYSTQKIISSGYGEFQYSCVDASGMSSNTITVKMDFNTPSIITLLSSSEGNLVNFSSMKEGYWVVNGVKRTTKSKYLTLTENGTYEVYLVDEDGVQSVTADGASSYKFSIPYKKGSTTTTTTTKKPTTTTTKKPTTTTTKKPTSTTTTVTESLSLLGVTDGGFANESVIVSASSDVYFTINGVKEAKASKTITISEDGEYVVSAANSKGVKIGEVSFTIDTVPPTVTLEVNGLEVLPGIFEDAVSVIADAEGYAWYVSGEEINVSSTSHTFSESGTYTVEVKDKAGNATSVDFVINMPNKDDKPSSNNGGNPLLYAIGGALLGGAVVFGVLYFMNRKKDSEDEE